MPIRVLLVDDQPILTDGIRTILAARASEFAVVGQISHAKEVVEAAQKLTPDVILLDINMPHKDSLELLRELHAFTTSTWKPSVYADMHYIAKAINGHAQGFLVKENVGEREVVDALRAVASGRSYFCSISQKVRIELLDESPQDLASLTTRQMSIAKLVASGKTSQAIADELSLSPRTVEGHRAAILRKLHLQNVADLVVYVKEQGW